MTFIQNTIENTSLALEIKHFLLSSDFVDLYKSLMFISCLLINDSSLIDFLYCIALMSWAFNIFLKSSSSSFICCCALYSSLPTYFFGCLLVVDDFGMIPSMYYLTRTLLILIYNSSSHCLSISLCSVRVLFLFWLINGKFKISCLFNLLDRCGSISLVFYESLKGWKQFWEIINCYRMKIAFLI